MTNIRDFFIWNFSVFGDEIFYIFELACFRNDILFCFRFIICLSRNANRKSDFFSLTPTISAMLLRTHFMLFCATESLLLTITTLWANLKDDKLVIFLIFSRKQNLTFRANCIHWRQCAWNVKSCFLEKKKKYFKMSSAENLPRVLIVNVMFPNGVLIYGFCTERRLRIYNWFLNSEVSGCLSLI